MEAVELYMVEMGAEEGEKLVPGCVRVDFLAICESLVDFEDGEADLYVVGGCRELGFWNPNNALKLKRLSGSRDLWRGSVHVSAEAMPQLEYKYVAKRTVVIPYIGDDPVTGMAWERQVAGNRYVATAKDRSCHFNEPAARTEPFSFSFDASHLQTL